MLVFTKEESSTIEEWAKKQPVHANKKPGITMLASNKAKFRPKAVEQDREGHYKTIIARRQLLTSQPAVGDASQDEDRSNGRAILHSHQWNG